MRKARRLRRLPRVLIVDDDDAVRRALRETLQSSIAERAWRIDEAITGYTAVDYVEHATGEGDPFALAFVDLHMPGMDGITTVERLWAVDGALQMVLCTGSRELRWDRVLGRINEQNRPHLLRKPFSAESVVMVPEVLTAKWARLLPGSGVPTSFGRAARP